jgi:hypothetical protein
MKADFRTAFKRYVDVVVTELWVEPAEEISSSALKAKVETLEETDAFQDLAKATQKCFAEEGIWITNLWRAELGNFFRRTGFYENVLTKQPLVNAEKLLEEYLASINRTDYKIRYFAPIDAIDFGVPVLDFGEFSIKKLSIKEIDDLFENDRRKVFYPSSIIQSKHLADYWCLDVTARMSRTSRDMPADWDFSPSFNNEVSSFPKPVENALKRLVLFDWQMLQQIGEPSNGVEMRWEPGKGWCRFNVPAVLSITDDLFAHLGNSTAIPPIDEEPRYMGESGEEEIWVPSYLSMSDEERTQLTNLVRRLNDLIPRLTCHKKWRFLDVALGFLVKAFFSEGLEQLLWHIAVVETLVGEDKYGLTELLKNRVAIIMGRTKGERETIRTAFSNLYAFRSNLVHGKDDILNENKIYVSHLRKAREFARETLIWFLDWLDIIDRRFSESPCPAGLPERTDLLRVLDMDGRRRLRVEWLVNNLPDQFPRI